MAKAKIIENKNKNIVQKAASLFLEYFNILAIAAALIILAAGLNYIIKPKYRSIMNVTKAKSLTNEKEYFSRLEYMDMINRLKLNYEKIDEKKINEIETFLPDEGYENELYLKMESLAEENGLYLSSLVVGGEDAETAETAEAGGKSRKAPVKSDLPPELKKIRISLNLSGLDYYSFKNFLSAVEKNLQLTDISSIVFSPSTGALQVEMYSYFYVTS